MATTLSSISEKASLCSPVPVTISNELHYSDSVSLLMNIIKVHVEEGTAVGYSKRVSMDIPEIVLHTAIVRRLELSDDHSFEVPYEKFVKVGWDRDVFYGDGGSAALVYPLFYSRCLAVPDEIKTALINDLTALGEDRKDWHDECPVLDIIDPDLAPNYYFPSKKSDKYRKDQSMLGSH